MICCFADPSTVYTVYPKKYAHGFCFAVLFCCYTLTDFPISIRLTSLALWQSNDCPSASKATLMNMDKYFMWIHYEWLHNHNKAKHNKTVWLFLEIYCISAFHIFISLKKPTLWQSAIVCSQEALNTPVAFCKSAVTTIRKQWSYCNLALSHRYCLFILFFASLRHWR